MDSKIEECYRLNVTKERETHPKLKGKDKTRKEMNKDNVCVVNENENGAETKARVHHLKDRGEIGPEYCAGLQRHANYGLKLDKKGKSRHLKSSPLKEDCNLKSITAKDENKQRHKGKDFERHNNINGATADDFSQEKEKNDPSVIVLHKYKKGIFRKQPEPYIEDLISAGKTALRPEKNIKKINIDENSNPQKHVLLNGKNSCEELKKPSKEINVESKYSLDCKQSKDQNRKKRDKKVAYKTLSTNIDSKLRKKRKKLERQQMLKEVVSTLNADKGIYDKIKALPIKIDENQLIFMHPSHVAKALEHFKIKKHKHKERVTTDSTCNDFNERNLKNNNKDEEHTEASLTKLDKNSSKKLRVLSSVQKLKKSFPIELEEKSDISLIKVTKHKKDAKKIRGKLTKNGEKKTIQEEPGADEESRGSEQIKIKSNLMPNENCSTTQFSVIRQNVCFGDNSIDVRNVKNNRLPTILSSRIRSKTNFNKVGTNFKNGPANELNVKRIHQKEMEKLKSLVKGNDDYENKIKLSTSEDENKLTFQLLKSNMNSKNLGRLRKNVYSVSDRMGKEEENPAIQNDRLYVTKRMLFYTNKESSSTSKESLNIAIRRDTEISHSGSSNNVLNVVIKQKKNSSTSTKSINSPKLAIENQCSKHCDTKSLEKMFVDNYLEKMYKSTNMNKNRQLKEAECQTEENTFGSNSKEQCRNEVPHFFELNKDNVQDEFQSFLKLHFKNINPTVWRNNSLNKHNEEVLNKKTTFQPGTEITHVQCKFEDNCQQGMQGNLKPLNSEHQCTQSSSYINNNFEATSCFKNNCKAEIKPFIRVLDNDEFDLQKTKYAGVSEVNGSDKQKEELNESQGITQINTIIPNNQCKKTESKTIAEKLKNIGLSDKKSFVKVINSNNNLAKDILKFQPVVDPQIKKKDILKKPDTENSNNLKNVIYRKQKCTFFSLKNSTNPFEGIVSTNVSNSFCTKKNTSEAVVEKENCFLERNNDNKPDSYTLWDMGKTNNFQIKIEDNINLIKENFINVLTANEEKEKEDIIPKTNRGLKNKVELTKKPSYNILRDSIVTEVEINKMSCDPLPSVPYKNVTCTKKFNTSDFYCKDESNRQEGDFPQEEPDLCNENKIGKLNHVDSVDILPQKKGSFVHVINQKYHTDKFLNTSNIFLAKNNLHYSPPVDHTESKIKKSVSVMNKFYEEKHIIDKINAVYEFLQHLEKVLKSNAISKLGANITNVNNLGNLNSTLRCLCNNCMEILNKIEVNKIETLKDREPPENLSAPIKEAIGRKKEHFPNGTTLTEEQYIAHNELKNNCTKANDITLNKGQMNPFYVIVPPEEKSRQHNYNDFFKKIDSEVKENITNFEFRERSYEDFIKKNFNELASKTSVNKTLNSMNICKSESRLNKKGKVSNRFYKNVQHGTMTPSNDYSNKCLSLIPLEKPYEPESRLNKEGYDHIYEFHPLDTTKPQIECINNLNSEFQVDLHSEKNMHNYCPKYFFTKQGQSSKDPNSVPCNSFKNDLSPMENGNSKNILCSSSPKNKIQQQSFTNKKNLFREKNGNLQNYTNAAIQKIQSKITGFETGFCKDLSMTSECSKNIKLPNKKEKLIPRLKSSVKIMVKKIGKTAPNSLPQCVILPNDKIRKTKLLGKKNIEETKPQVKNITECLQKPIMTNTQLNVENDHNSSHSLYNEDINHCSEGKRDLLINSDNKYFEREIIDEDPFTDSNQKHNQISKSVQMPLSNIHSPHGSIIIIKRNLHIDSTMKNAYTSNSVEYLYSSIEGLNENESSQEDKEMDSEGWVPITNMTEIEKNNKIYLGMDIKNMPVKHFHSPEDQSQCNTTNKNE